jgi:hypothetical protein
VLCCADCHLPPAQSQRQSQSQNQLPPSSSSEGKRHRAAPFAAPLQAPNTHTRARASASELMGQYLSPPPRASDPSSNHFLHTTREKTKTRSKSKSNHAVMSKAATVSGAGAGGGQGDFASTPKSRFTGAGLGLKKGETLDFQPQGSARQIIGRVLQQQLRDMGD